MGFLEFSGPKLKRTVLMLTLGIRNEHYFGFRFSLNANTDETSNVVFILRSYNKDEAKPIILIYKSTMPVNCICATLSAFIGETEINLNQLAD